MKKHVLALALSFLPIGSSNAGVGTGFYLGANTGYMNSSTELKATGASVHLGRHRPHVGAFAGYGFMQNALYIAFELGYGYEPNSFQAKLGTIKIKFDRKHNFLAALRLGVLLNQNTMIYGRVGGNYAKYHVETKIVGKVSGKKRLSPVAGLGIETAIPGFNRNMLLRTEWTYDFGHTLKGKNIELKKLHTQKFTLGAAYRF